MADFEFLLTPASRAFLLKILKCNADLRILVQPVTYVVKRVALKSLAPATKRLNMNRQHKIAEKYQLHVKKQRPINATVCRNYINYVMPAVYIMLHFVKQVPQQPPHKWYV
jgi:hypothetical protein